MSQINVTNNNVYGGAAVVEDEDFDLAGWNDENDGLLGVGSGQTAVISTADQEAIGRAVEHVTLGEDVGALDDLLSQWADATVQDPLAGKPLHEKWFHCYHFVMYQMLTLAGDSKANQVISKLMLVLSTLLKGITPFKKDVMDDIGVVSPMRKQELAITTFEELYLVVRSLHVQTKTIDWSPLRGMGIVSGKIWRLDGGKFTFDLTYAPYFISGFNDKGSIYNDSLHIDAYLKDQNCAFRSEFFVSCAYYAKFLARDKNVMLAFPGVPNMIVESKNFTYGQTESPFAQYIVIAQQFAEARCTPSAFIKTTKGTVKVALAKIICAHLTRLGSRNCRTALDEGRVLRKNTVLDTILKEIHSNVPFGYSLIENNAYESYLSVVEKFVPVQQKILAIKSILQKREKELAVVYVGVTKKGPNYQMVYAERFCKLNNIPFAFGDILCFGDNHVDVANEGSVKKFIASHQQLDAKAIYLHLDISDDSAVSTVNNVATVVSACFAHSRVVGLTIKTSAFENYVIPGGAEFVVDSDNEFIGVRPHNGETMIYVAKSNVSRSTHFGALSDGENLTPIAQKWRQRFIAANSSRGLTANALKHNNYDVAPFSPVVRQNNVGSASIFKKKQTIPVEVIEVRPSVPHLQVIDSNDGDVWLCVIPNKENVYISPKSLLINSDKLKDTFKALHISMTQDRRFVTATSENPFSLDLSASLVKCAYGPDEVIDQ